VFGELDEGLPPMLLSPGIRYWVLFFFGRLLPEDMFLRLSAWWRWPSMVQVVCRFLPVSQVARPGKKPPVPSLT